MKIVQRLLEKKDVILDFDLYINNYCEQIHLTDDIPRFKICMLVIDEFKSDFSEDFIRRKVSDIYKVKHKSNNAKKKGLSLLEKLKAKASVIDAEIKSASKESIAFVEKN